MKIKALSLVALAAITAGALSLAEPAAAAGGAKTTFERNKPHVNVLTEDGQPGTRGGQKKPRLAELVFKQPYPNGPLVGAPKSGYCGSNQGGGVAKSVVIVVKNNGNETAGHFMVKVDFLDYPGTSSRAFGPINPRSGADLDSFVIPKQAWKNGMARFTVEIDSQNEIDEGAAGEANNTMEGYCVAPAG